MPALDENVREHVVRETRQEISRLALDGIPGQEIELRVNGRRTLTAAEQGLIELLTYHAVAEAQGRY